MGSTAVKGWPALKGREGVVLDTMVWIYLFEDHPRYAQACERLVRAAADGVFSGIISPISIAELIVKPLQMGRMEIAERYRMAAHTMKGITPRALDAEVGYMAGALRARYKRPLPDMLQAAMALREPAATLVTHDKDLCCVKELTVVMVSDL